MARRNRIDCTLRPDGITNALTVHTAKYGKHTCIVDTFRAFDIVLPDLRVYPSLYQGKLCLFCSPQGKPKPRPLHLFLHGNGSTFRNGNSLDCRAINIVKAGELHSNVVKVPTHSYRAYADVRGEYINLGTFKEESEALQAVEDAATLYKELLTDLLGVEEAGL